MHWVLERIIVGRADRQTIAKYAVGPDRFLGVGLMLCAALLGLGVTQPLITSGGFMGLQGQYSLLALMAEFFKSGRGGLALSLAVLLVLLPVVLLSTAFDISGDNARAAEAGGGAPATSSECRPVRGGG